jgi:hypothetical protein
MDDCYENLRAELINNDRPMNDLVKLNNVYFRLLCKRGDSLFSNANDSAINFLNQYLITSGREPMNETEKAMAARLEEYMKKVDDNSNVENEDPESVE